MISCHIEKYNHQGNIARWDWWKPLVWIDEEFTLEQCVKAFNPIYRLSAKAMTFLDEYLKQGCCGHFETILSTVLYNHGFKLLDMGGMGEFTPLEYTNKFYIQGYGVNNGTMRYRPIFLEEEIKALNVPNMLFHPLK